LDIHFPACLLTSSHLSQIFFGSLHPIALAQCPSKNGRFSMGTISQQLSAVSENQEKQILG
jgi:hypothetical protein